VRDPKRDREREREGERESSGCEGAKNGEDGERCCVLKGDIPWMIFYSWSSSPSTIPRHLPGLLSPVDAVLAAPPVSSASKRGSRPGLMDFTTPWGPFNPHSPSPLTSRARSPTRAFPHTFLPFHVSAHIRRGKCGAFLFLALSLFLSLSLSLCFRINRRIFVASITRSGPSAKMYRPLTSGQRNALALGKTNLIPR
jgi:hypothetical protein